MALAKVNIEGTAEVAILDVSCTCEKCNNTDRAGASLNISFKEKKMYYLCGACKHMNEMYWGSPPIQPYPRTRFK